MFLTVQVGWELVTTNWKPRERKRKVYTKLGCVYGVAPAYHV